MIVRREPDGSLILITQNDHAKLSGVFAAHWGNSEFAALEPYESMVRAAACHDAGWSRYETEPLYDLVRKQPPTFFEVPNSPEQVAAFQAAIDWLRAIDSYAGLMISRHRTGLWRQRYGSVSVSSARPARDLGPPVEDMIRREEARQQEALARLDRRRFDVNYQLLQIFDLLSLYLCTAKPQQRQLDHAPRDYNGDGQGGVSLCLTPRDDNVIVVAPYPFDARPLEVSVVYRRLSTSDYPSVAAFRAAYFGAPPRTMRFILAP
jgi:hypothetical protein